MFRCKSNYSAPVKSIVVLSKRHSPTRDLYLTERLKTAVVPVHLWFLGDKPPCNLDGAFVIIVRYVERKSVRALQKAHNVLAGVAYLMDDDIAGSMHDIFLPKHYRIILGYFWMRWRKSLEKISSELWLSSDALVETYGTGERIDPFVAPFPMPKDRLPEQPDDIVRIACHSSKTHREDLIWLSDVIAEVQRRCKNTEVEIIGDRKGIKLFNGIPRVSAMRVIPWENYVEYVRNAPRIDIGLVPMINNRFNHFRSWTKYLDVARWGAVGVYAKPSPYEAVVDDTINGLLVSNDKSLWVEAIVELSSNHEVRRMMAKRVNFPEKINTPPSLVQFCI